MWRAQLDWCLRVRKPWQFCEVLRGVLGAPWPMKFNEIVSKTKTEHLNSYRENGHISIIDGFCFVLILRETFFRGRLGTRQRALRKDYFNAPKSLSIPCKDSTGVVERYITAERGS